MKINLLKIKHREQKGFTIVETLLTLLAITIMITAPLTFMARSYKYAEFIKVRVVGTALAQEGLELVTSLRNFDLTSFDDLTGQCSTSCAIDWDGVSNRPTFTPCVDQYCRLYKNTSTGDMYRLSGASAENTDYYRYIKITQDTSAPGYALEAVVWTNVEGVKVETKVKKMIFNLTIH